MAVDAKRRKPKNSGENSGASEGERLPITTLAPDPKNPRTMKDAARAGLAVSLETFGPLDITFNLRTGQLVSGHQRIASLKAAGATELVKISPEWAYVQHPKTGERFWIRFVDWDGTKQTLGNLVANSPALQGDFTEEALDQAKSVQKIAEAQGLELDDLVRRLEAQFKAAGGPGQDGSSDQSGSLADSWQIVITCSSEQHQRKLLERFGSEGLQCRALI